MSGIDVLGLKDSNPNIPFKASYAHPYASSNSSSASSSSSSVFSLDGVSTQSSISSTSTNPVDVIWENDGEPQLPARGLPSTNARGCLRPKVDAPVAPELRKHPRRTNSGVAPASCTRPPPCLLRQSERKVNFVDNLVDTASQIVETIWPLSAVAHRSDSATGCKGVLPLRTFIQETLRRSRTSYSTLQVALYYLIKIKPHVPGFDATQDQSRAKPACRAMQCGRRMFLAALILASKYLQDRNYSARAWSKISGLNTVEINQNELMFLEAVSWRLHIPEALFQRWTDIVLKLTPSAGGLPIDGHTWRTVIPKLNPDLEEIDPEPMTPLSMGGYDSFPVADSPSPRGTSTRGPSEPCSLPSIHESLAYGRPSPLSRLPPINRVTNLPTPQMTPQLNVANTPAASGGNISSHRRYICSAMSQAQNMGLARSTLDQRPPMSFCPKAGTIDGYPTTGRRSSLARSTSSTSSPDSMVSDTSSFSSNLSRSSRSSSMSSNASGPGGVPLPRLAVQATLRCTSNSMKECPKPLYVGSPTDEGAFSDTYNSPAIYGGPLRHVPESFNPALGSPVYMSLAHEAAQGLCELSGALPRPQAVVGQDQPRQCRKRGRTGSDDLLLQHHVRELVHANPNPEGMVLPDGKIADPFRNPEFKRSQSLTATQLQALNYAPLSGPAGMKRACCGSEAKKIALHPRMRAEY